MIRLLQYLSLGMRYSSFPLGSQVVLPSYNSSHPLDEEIETISSVFFYLSIIFLISSVFLFQMSFYDHDCLLISVLF